jgi:hypothetical protein
MTDVDKRQLAIDAAEAIDPSIAADAQHVAETIDPTIKARMLQHLADVVSLKQRGQALLDDYQRGLDANAPRNAAELAEIKAIFDGIS